MAIDNSRSTQSLARTVELCDALLASRESDLLSDLDYYTRKLRDLTALDPADRTGLRRLYRQHVRHIGSLLTQFGG